MIRSGESPVIVNRITGLDIRSALPGLRYSVFLLFYLSARHDGRLDPDRAGQLHFANPVGVRSVGCKDDGKVSDRQCASSRSF